MPTKIRLQRRGKRGQPFYHIVIADGRAPRDGKFIEKYLILNCNNKYIIDNLPNSIEEITLEGNFNLELNNLPNGIKKIIFHRYSVYSYQLNCLPNSIEYIKLGANYNLKINKFPLELKIIECSEQYKFIDDLTNYDLIRFLLQKNNFFR